MTTALSRSSPPAAFASGDCRLRYGGRCARGKKSVGQFVGRVRRCDDRTTPCRLLLLFIVRAARDVVDYCRLIGSSEDRAGDNSIWNDLPRGTSPRGCGGRPRGDNISTHTRTHATTRRTAVCRRCTAACLPCTAQTITSQSVELTTNEDKTSRDETRDVHHHDTTIDSDRPRTATARVTE